MNTTSNTALPVFDSVIANKANGGIWVKPTGSTNAAVTLNRVHANKNKFGIVADGAATTGKIGGIVASGSTAGLLVADSTIYGNAGGVFTSSSGVIDSYGNNRLNGNNGQRRRVHSNERVPLSCDFGAHGRRAEPFGEGEIRIAFYPSSCA